MSLPCFSPDYQHVVDAAWNRTPERIPLYEHIISDQVMEEVLCKEFALLYAGDSSDRREFFRTYANFFLQMGYDTVSFERCIGVIMPGSPWWAQAWRIKTRDFTAILGTSSRTGILRPMLATLNCSRSNAWDEGSGRPRQWRV